MKFTFSEVAEIAQVPVSTIRNWFTQGHIELERDDEPAAPGGIRYLSTGTAMAVAIAAAFTRMGVLLPRAVQAGRLFSYSGSDTPGDERQPGELYGGKATTFIVVLPGDEAPTVFAMGGMSPKHVLPSKLGDRGGVIVPIDPIYARMQAHIAAKSAAPARKAGAA
jgi:hypothetical protein